MKGIDSFYDRVVHGDPPWFTELLSTLQSEPGFENLGLAGVQWDESLTDLFAYKNVLIDRFNEYYALYEIGQETPQRFQFMCNRHYNSHKRKWNYMIKLYENNVTTQLGRLNKTIKVSEILKNITGVERESRDGSDIISGQHDNVQTYDTKKESKEYSTPVTQIQSLNDGYLSGGSGEDNTTDVTGTNSINDNTQIHREGTKDTSKDDNTNEETSLEYTFYDKPVVELIEENINVWNDVLQSIIEDWKELFINVTARI